ncbi:MAG: hypothetical protein J4G06_12710 [Caldilineaceae bacterium]|nr:hypothetical protein [Caldilineaceae bacterium]
MTAGDLETLRRLGFSEEAVMDAVQIIAFFNYITRVADALGLQPEEFLETTWGRLSPTQAREAEATAPAAAKFVDPAVDSGHRSR